MTLEEAIKHAEEVMVENLEKTKGRNASDPIAMNCFECAKEHLQLEKWLKELKQLREQTKWIPVSERLPESDGDYFLFGKVVEDDTEDVFIGTYDACAEKFGYWEDYYDSKTLGFLDSELIEYNKAIAWMSLPEPYNVESEDKE